MRRNLTNSNKLRLAAVFILVFVLLSGVFAFFEVRMYYQRRENNLYLAVNQVRLMQGSLDAVISRVYTLRSLVKSNKGNTDFFEEAAEEIYTDTAADTNLYVKNFILAPDGIVEKIYPMEGNESLLGFDYMDTSQAGNEAAVEAYEKNQLVLTDPFTLKQGGNGLAGRLPVYITEDGEKKFWGMVSVTLDVDYLLEQFNLDYLEKAGTNYSLWYKNSSGEKVVLASSATLPKNAISYEMTSNNLSWTLDVSPKNGWLPPFELFAGGAVILLISFIAMWMLRSGTKIRAMNDMLKEIAIRDNLTDCYSRHFVNTMLLAPDSKKWKDPNSCYSLAVIDMDYFKEINDTYGHDTGDHALAAVAHTIQDSCDRLRGDCVIRYGGDEFILLMNHVYRELFEERLRHIINQVKTLRLPDAPDMQLSVSIGAVMGNKTSTYYELFSRADKLLYLVKESGKGYFQLEAIDGENA